MLARHEIIESAVAAVLGHLRNRIVRLFHHARHRTLVQEIERPRAFELHLILVAGLAQPWGLTNYIAGVAQKSRNLGIDQRVAAAEQRFLIVGSGNACGDGRPKKCTQACVLARRLHVRTLQTGRFAERPETPDARNRGKTEAIISISKRLLTNLAGNTYLAWDTKFQCQRIVIMAQSKASNDNVEFLSISIFFLSHL